MSEVQGVKTLLEAIKDDVNDAKKGSKAFTRQRAMMALLRLGKAKELVASYISSWREVQETIKSLEKSIKSLKFEA